MTRPGGGRKKRLTIASNEGEELTPGLMQVAPASSSSASTI